MLKVVNLKQLDKTIPKGKWEFDKDVTKVFNNMLTRSIPQYLVMRDLVANYAKNFISEGSCDIIDLGSSRGEAIKSMLDLGRQNRFTATEISEPMLLELNMLANNINKANNNYLHIENFDLRLSDESLLDMQDRNERGHANLVTSVLTLMFVPMEHRQNLLESIVEVLLPEGAFIIVEKILGSTPKINKIMVEQYLKMKSDNGYTTEEIDRKKSSLEGVLVPLTIEQNEILFKNAGFKTSEIFWKWNNFTAWICTK